MHGHCIRQDYVSASDDTRLFYTAHGEGPAIVCTYGIGSNAVFFRNIVEAFRDRYQVITWDLRGHGLSYFPESLDRLDIPLLASDLIHVLDHLEIDKAILFGHHVGVQITLEALRHDADRASGLVLASGVPAHPLRQAFGRSVEKHLFNAAAAIGMNAPSVVEYLAEKLSRSPRWSSATLGRYLGERNGGKTDFQNYLRHLCRMDAQLVFLLLRAADDHAADDLLSEVRVPTLIVGGMRDRFVPPSEMERLHDRIEGSELLLVRGGGNAVMLEQPELIQLALDKFLRDRLGGTPWDLTEGRMSS